MTRFDRTIEEQIRRAMAEGAFDNLPGQGEPLPLEENPHADPEKRLAWHMLQSNNFSLPWLEHRRGIESGLEEARARLRTAWQAFTPRQSEGQPQATEPRWQNALAAFRESIEKLNRQIFDYNLEVPSPRFQRLLLDAEREIRLIQDDQRRDS